MCCYGSWNPRTLDDIQAWQKTIWQYRIKAMASGDDAALEQVPRGEMADQTEMGSIEKLRVITRLA